MVIKLAVGSDTECQQCTVQGGLQYRNRETGQIGTFDVKLHKSIPGNEILEKKEKEEQFTNKY